jgi:hypothetical protein
MANEPVAVKMNYKFDAFLLYLIQQQSNKPSAEIMNFFHELCKQVCAIGVDKRTGRGIRKNITDYYPGTSVPFNLLVKGRIRGRYDHKTQQHIDGQDMACDVEVGFPTQKVYVKEQALDEIAVAIMEQALMDGEEITRPPFVRPDIKTPPMYRDLMDSFAGREPQPKKERRKK